jgi:hypothetical protein
MIGIASDTDTSIRTLGNYPVVESSRYLLTDPW